MLSPARIETGWTRQRLDPSGRNFVSCFRSRCLLLSVLSRLLLSRCLVRLLLGRCLVRFLLGRCLVRLLLSRRLVCCFLLSRCLVRLLLSRRLVCRLLLSGCVVRCFLLGRLVRCFLLGCLVCCLLGFRLFLQISFFCRILLFGNSFLRLFRLDLFSDWLVSRLLGEQGGCCGEGEEENKDQRFENVVHGEEFRLR